jgi:hypothetical protein
MGTTSRPSSIRWQNSGRWTSSGECWTLNGSESPSADAVSLSWLVSILEPSVPSKFFLSERACAGIVRRARDNDAPLPPVLWAVLIQQAGNYHPMESTKGLSSPEDETDDFDTES